MKVILLQKVAGLGNIDDEKEVADGYALNFLFPRHLAVQASVKAVAGVKARQKKTAKEAHRELKEEQQLVEQLDGREFTLKEKANDQGVLYAAVTPTKVSELLSSQNFLVGKNCVKMEPIKEVGNYPILLRFKHGLEAEITLVITSH